MSQLYIPNSVALRNFDSLFKNNNNFTFEDSNVDITFHPKYVALHPVGLAFYAAIADTIKQHKYNRNAKINYGIRSIPFLQRMGLFRVFEYLDPVSTKEHEESGRFIPLTKITNNEDLNNLLINIDPILHTNRETSRVIKHVFSEVLRNVLEHSQAPLGGNVCATYNKKRKKISIGISDAGIGLKASLSRHHFISNYKDAVIKALTPGITGVTSRIGGNSENAGAGLFFTKCIAQSTKNHFVLYSGSSYFKLKLTPKKRKIKFNSDPTLDYCSIKEGLPFFGGTLIGIDIYIEDNEAFNDLISNIGNAYTISVKNTSKNYKNRIKFT